MSPARPDQSGFTLIEVLVTVAIIAVLASLAVPSYADHVRRARIVEAAVRLADLRVRLEQHFLDFRRYDDGDGQCGFPPPTSSTAADSFRLICEATATSYLIRASGNTGQGMDGFEFTLDHTNGRATPAVPPGWMASDTCWVFRRDGACL